MPATQDTVQARLEASRKELLDLGLRNPLLNYRPSRARGVVVVDELPEEVFRLLVTEARAHTFLPAVDEPEEGLLGQPTEPLAAGKSAARHTDTRLQTGLPSGALQTALLNTYYAARTFIEEQGANVLFLALGMLEWTDRATPGERHRAPLVLVPVELSRSSAVDRFQLRYSGEELGENLSLATKLKSEPGLTLPPLPAAEDLDLKAYFAEVAEAVASQPGWRVDREAVVLGFFSFGKFLMYRDLDAASWPAEASPGAHPLLAALLGEGFREPPAPLGDQDVLDDKLAVDELLPVVEADSSQLLAIASVNAGRNVVIQGPPGTGKSQTIANLVADAIGRGKTVLFVAEKMAALDVVKRRLDAIGLGDACLELHSHKTNKKAVLAELSRTLQQGKPRESAEMADDLTLYSDMRDRLNAYCEAVNRPIGTSGVSPFEALGTLLRARAGSLVSPVVALDLPELATWTAAEWKRRWVLAQQLQAQIVATGPAPENPYWGSRLTSWVPGRGAELTRAADETAERTRALVDAATLLAPSAGLAAPTTLAEAERVVHTARLLMERPDLTGVRVEAPEWLEQQTDLRRMMQAGARMGEIRFQYVARVRPIAWTEHLLDLRLHLAAHGASWSRWLSPDYRRARARLAALVVGDLPTSLQERLALVDAIMEGQRQRGLMREAEGIAPGLFGPLWQPEDADWAALQRIADWLASAHAGIAAGDVAPTLFAQLAADAPPSPDPAALAIGEKALAEADAAWTRLLTTLAFRPPAGSVSPAELPFGALAGRLEAWAKAGDRLPDLVAYNQLTARLLDDGLGGLVAQVEASPGIGPHAADLLLVARHEALLARAIAERPAFSSFSSVGHELEIERFRELDQLITEHNRARLASLHWQSLPRHEGGGQLAVLRREFEKKSRHLPIRQLMARAGVAVQAIKPVFMMSPMSIASFLPPDSLAFDLVVFDEASQVKPVDAFGALLRARQAVVVGDKRQMPPTNFFDTLAAPDVDDSDNTTSDFESVLGLFEAQGAPQHMLRWHYRSRHESLIAVSNREFYGGRLVIFPSPDAARADVGLHYRLTPGQYDRGGSRTNPEEAQAVAEAVMRHARTQPERTLGVAAFSLSQKEAIQAAVERARRADPASEAFFGGHPHEPFFVKNLETVQGDERDVMLVSIGYGRDPDGKLSLSFGPLNADGGERRLNVLITRARQRLEVFTHLHAEDLVLGPEARQGLVALKHFLAYAEHGELSGGETAPAAPPPAFEEAVASAVEAMGFDVARRVGQAGFFVDLAVRDPAAPGRYLLAISCDGDTYASARSARDRDRLRQQVLGQLGWRLHRVWSAEWLRKPEAERARLQRALEAARDAAQRLELPTVQTAAPPLPLEREPEAQMATAVLARVTAYAFADLSTQLAGQDLLAVPTNTLAGCVADAVSVESPVHRSEVVKRIAQAAGLKRPGAKAIAAIEAAIQFAARGGAVLERGPFLWRPDMDVAVVRDRAAWPAAQRKIDLVAPEELEQALERAAAESFGLAPDALVLAAAKLLGYSRPGVEARGGVERVMQALIARGRLAVQAGHLILRD